MKLHPVRAALYRKHLTHIAVWPERRCAVCGRWVSGVICGSASFEGLAAGEGFCMSRTRKGRTRYRVTMELPGMALGPKDFPEHAEKVRGALAQARTLKAFVRIPL